VTAGAPGLELRRLLTNGADLAALVVAGSFPLALLAFYASSTALRLLTIAMQLGVFAYMLLVSENRVMKSLCVGLAIMTMPVALLNFVGTEMKSLIVPLCFLAGTGCAWFALEFNRSRLLFELPFYAYLGLTVFLIVVLGYGPTEFNQVYSGISRNGYSAILFATACGYVISRVKRGLCPSLLLLACALACTIPLYGRSSIAAMAVLFAAAAMHRWPRFAILSALLATAFIVIGSMSIDALAQATNFRGGIESDRWVIIDEYLSLMNPGTLTLGVPFDDVWAIRQNGGSPDIAFLRLHSFLGVGILFLLGCFAVSAWSMLVERQNLLIGVFLAVMFRASTDVILMFGTVDFFFMPVLLFMAFSRYFPRAKPQRR
jgi:hypothetical protein